MLSVLISTEVGKVTCFVFRELGEGAYFLNPFTIDQIAEPRKTTIDAPAPIPLPINILSFQEPSPIYSVNAQIPVNKKIKIRAKEVIIMT